ncbi:MAG: ribonuclease HI [Christensenellales bacterium]|jgi:ribonuclease HI
MKQVTIYTDGACSGNPGPGGWGAVLLYGKHEKEMSGFSPHTTNNRMELTAAIEALGALKEPCEVKLCSDSSYLIDGFTKGWVFGWQKRGWVRGKDRQPVLNPDLWQKLLEFHRTHKIEWIKVRGHADDEINNRCDKLATSEIERNSARE